MLKIRLSRGGKKGQPAYRVVVQEHTAPIKGKFIELIGSYLPAAKPKVIKINLERAKYWISVGARPSDTVAVLLKKEGMEGMDKFIAPRDKKRKKKKEEAPAEESKAEEPKKEEAPAEEAKTEEPKKEEAPAEEAKTEEPKKEEAPAEEAKAEAPEASPPAEEPKVD